MVLFEPFLISSENKEKVSVKVQALLQKGYVKSDKERPTILEYIMDNAFDEIRPQYTKFFKKIFNISGLPIPEKLTFEMNEKENPSSMPEDIQTTDMKLTVYKILNFRNNIMEYSKLAEVLNKISPDNILGLLLYKKHIQLLLQPLACMVSQSAPKSYPFVLFFENIYLWEEFLRGFHLKFIINLFRKDILTIKESYFTTYKTILLNNCEQKAKLPEYDISVQIDIDLREYINEILNNIDKIVNDQKLLFEIKESLFKIVQYESLDAVIFKNS